MKQPTRRPDHAAHRRRVRREEAVTRSFRRTSRRDTCCRGRSSELDVHAERFVVAVHGAQDRRLRRARAAQPARGRSAIARRRRSARGSRVGVAIVDELRLRARREGYEKLCAFTHAPRYFIHMGFSIVPHLWLTEKIFTDCVKCPLFRQCGQYAMVVPLDVAFDAERGYGLPLACRRQTGSRFFATSSSRPVGPAAEPCRRGTRAGGDREPMRHRQTQHLVISARLAPFPPSRSFMSIGGLRCLWSKA